MDVPHNNSVSDQNPTVSSHADNPPQAGANPSHSNSSVPHQTKPIPQYGSPATPYSTTIDPSRETAIVPQELPRQVTLQSDSALAQQTLGAVQQTLLATQVNLTRSQQHLEALQREAQQTNRRGVFARLFGPRSKTIVKVQVKNSGNTTTSTSPKRDFGQHVRDLIEESAPRVLEFFLSLNSTQVLNLYNKADGDLSTVIQLCTQVQQSLHSRSRPDVGSLQVAFAAYMSMTESLRRTLWAYAAEILQTNPEVPVVRPDKSAVTPRDTAAPRRQLSPVECQSLAGKMTVTMQDAIDTLRLIQQGLRSSRTMIADPLRMQMATSGMRDADLYPVVNAINQANALAIQLGEAQGTYFRQLFEVPTPRRNFWHRGGKSR